MSPEVTLALTAPESLVRPGRASLGLRPGELALLVGTVDLCLINTAFFLYMGLAFSASCPKRSLLVLWSLVLSIVWMTVSLSLRAYDFRSLVPARSAWVAGKAALLTACVYFLIPFATPVLPDRRLLIFLFPVMGMACIVPWRLLTAVFFSRPEFRQRAVLVGKGGQAAPLVQACSGGPGFSETPPYELVGFVGHPTEQPRYLPYLGVPEDLASICERVGADELVVSDDLSEIRGDYLSAVLQCHERGVQVLTAAQLHEMITGRVSLEEGNLYDVLPLFRGPSHRLYLGIKRLLDLGMALVGCLLTLLVAPFLVLANLFFNPGPLLYRQVRVGLGGRTFLINKFRSMTCGAEKNGAVFCAPNDPRVTRLGRLLRLTRIDEWPQFFNVLWGDMSCVGPRPERPEFVAGFNETIPFYRARHSVRPGLTGWAQAEFRYGCSPEDTLKKLQYDLFYVKHQSLYFDYFILLRTLQVVFGLKGR